MKSRRMCETCEHFQELKRSTQCKMDIHMSLYKDRTGDTYHSVPGCKFYEPDKMVLHFEKFPGSLEDR